MCIKKDFYRNVATRKKGLKKDATLICCLATHVHFILDKSSSCKVTEELSIAHVESSKLSIVVLSEPDSRSDMSGEVLHRFTPSAAKINAVILSKRRCRSTISSGVIKPLTED